MDQGMRLTDAVRARDVDQVMVGREEYERMMERDRRLQLMEMQQRPRTWADTFAQVGTNVAMQMVGVVASVGAQRAIGALTAPAVPVPRPMPLRAHSQGIVASVMGPTESAPMDIGPAVAVARALGNVPREALGGGKDLIGFPGQLPGVNPPGFEIMGNAAAINLGPLSPGLLRHPDPAIQFPTQPPTPADRVDWGKLRETANSGAFVATGTAVGTYVGQVVIPVPVVGAAVGGIIGGIAGSLVGDVWNDAQRGGRI